MDEIETEITQIIKELNPPPLSIKGIGEISAAVIISEFDDFSRFDNPNQMLSFAGLERGYFKSGTSEHKGRMVKCGFPHTISILIFFFSNCDWLGKYVLSLKAIISEPAGLMLATLYRRTIFFIGYF